MRTEKFNLCKSTKKLLTLITLLTLGVGQMWATDYILGPDGSWTENAAHTLGSSGINNWVYKDLTVSGQWTNFKVKNDGTWYGKDSGGNNVAPGTEYTPTTSGDNMYCDFKASSLTYYFFFNTSTKKFMIQPKYYLAGTCGASDQNWSTTANAPTYDATNGYFKWNTSSLTAGTAYKFKMVTYNSWSYYNYQDGGSVSVSQGTHETTDGDNNIIFTPTYGGTAVVTMVPTSNVMVVHCPYQVSYNKGANGTGTNTTASKTWKTNLTLLGATFTRAGYTQDGWSTVDGGAKVYNLSGSYTTDADVTLYPHWTENMSTVSFVASPTGKGTFQVNSSTVTSTTAGVTTTRSVTAVPISGYHFVSWSITGGASISSTTTNPTTVTGGGAGTAATLTATFAADDVYSLTVAAGTGISAVTGSTNDIKAAQNIDITATVATGYTWNTWTKTGAGTLSTFTAGTKNQTVTVGTAGDITLTASATENKSSLTTSNHYDAGNPSYSVPSKSVSSIGITTQSTITAATPSTGYTFAGWTLSNNIVVVSGDKDNDLSLTIRTNGNGAAATAQANYEEVLTTAWTLKGSFVDDFATTYYFEKKSGESTTSIGYCTLTLDAGETYSFKVIKDGSTWYGNSGTMTSANCTDWTFTTAESSNAGITTTSAGTYQFKIDFSGANPVVSVIYPPTLTFSATSVYSGNASTLTASVSNVVSGKTIKYDVYAGATATGVAVATWSGSTSSTTHSHAFSNITPSFGANDISKQYTVKVTYDGSRIATYTGYIGRKWDIYVHDVQSWGMMKVHMWNAAGPKSTYPGDPCSLYNGSTSWYTVTLDGLYNGGFVLSANGDATKTSDQTMSISSFGAGTYWYVTAYKTGSLNSVSVSDPTVTLSATVTNTNQINLTGNVSNFGGDGTAASDMKEVYFKVNNVKDASSITASTTNGNFTKSLSNPTPDNTNNTLQAFATNIAGTGSSSAVRFTNVTLDKQSGIDGTSNVLAVNGVAMASGATAPSRSGYTFGGYFASTGGSGKQYYTNAMASANTWDQTTATKTIYAKWTANNYTVTLKPNGGSGDDQAVTATYDATMPTTLSDGETAITAPTKTGYIFGGYYENNDGTGTQYYEEDLDPTANTWDQAANADIYAKWTPKQSTLSFDYQTSATGYGTSGTVSAGSKATYDAAMPTLSGTLPTAANGYAFMGFYSATGGGGTKYYNADGTSANNWAENTESGTTLYAYYKKAEITALTFDAGTVEPEATVGVTPTISPTPVGETIICWTILYSNDTPLDPQPAMTWSDGKLTFAASAYSGTYKVQAVLRTGDACGAGDALDTETASFLVAGSHSVTVNYKCSSDVIKTATSVTGRPTEWSDDITAPDIFGYTFSSWSSADGVTIKDSEHEDVTSSTEATIKIKATYAGSLTANYTQNQMIFFKNTLGWENVYVNFYTGSYWNNPLGSGNQGVTNKNLTMTQYGESDIWYYDYGASSISPSLYVSFTSKSQDGAEHFWHTDGVDVVYPANYADNIHSDRAAENGFKAATPMFVPLAAQDYVLLNGKAHYYNAGYWSKYTPGTGYRLEIYNEAGNSMIKYKDFESADDLMPMKATVDLEGGQTYKFQIRRGGESSAGIYYGNSGTMDYTNHGQDVAWDLTNFPSMSKAGITTNAAGDYTFNLSYSAYHNESTDVDEYRLRIAVDYPVASGDYRLVYTDDVHTNPHPSAIVNKVNDGTDIVSFFVRHDQNPVVRIQQATVDGGTGEVTWNEYPNSGTPTNQITSTIASTISSSGTEVYNFNLSMNGSGALTVASAEVYDGNFYIRTDAASSKWDNYRTDPDHRMIYSEYSITHGGYTHYYTHWVDKDVTGRKNVKFCIANDYSPCISDTLAREEATGTWEHIADFMEEGGDLKRSANVRYMWDKRDNTISRAYVDGAQTAGTQFLTILSADEKILNPSTSEVQAITTFSDKGNWMYEANIKAKPGAQIKLKSSWGKAGETDHIIDQYFRGASDATEQLIGGSGSSPYDIRAIYDFKSNRLIAGLIPSGTIDEQMAIHADVMFVREHHGDIAQLTFAEKDSKMGAITDIETAYGVLQFNKWTINNKSKAEGHAPLSPLLSQFERDLFYVSFPFKVAMEDVFGFGTYGQHWIIEYYDGATRASKGYWAESGPNWKFVTNRKGKYFEPGQGYIIALDLDEMGESADIWANTDRVELYFPSYGTMDNITSSTATYEIPEHECTINRSNESNGHGGTLGPQYDRRVKDSHWNVLGVPTYVNPDAPNFANTDWTTEATETSIGPNFLYQWSMTDNTVSPVSASGYTYHAMHAYLVQYCGNVTWTSSVSVTPSSIVARRTYDEAPRSVEFRLELTQNDVAVDQTFVKLSDNEAVTTGFEFNFDLSKEFNKNRANIYTLIGTEQVAGNVLPLTDQTTVVPVGVSIPTAGDYTFSLPDGTEGIGVTLIDNQTGMRTRLSALDYTVNLTAGTHDGRFILEISPIHNATTEVELINGANGANDEIGARKVLIDGILYIVKGDKLYDVRGTMIK